jgi:hypothetical protein
MNDFMDEKSGRSDELACIVLRIIRNNKSKKGQRSAGWMAPG